MNQLEPKREKKGGNSYILGFFNCMTVFGKTDVLLKLMRFVFYVCNQQR